MFVFPRCYWCDVPNKPGPTPLRTWEKWREVISCFNSFVSRPEFRSKREARHGGTRPKTRGDQKSNEWTLSSYSRGDRRDLPPLLSHSSTHTSYRVRREQDPYGGRTHPDTNLGSPQMTFQVWVDPLDSYEGTPRDPDSCASRGTFVRIVSFFHPSNSL